MWAHPLKLNCLTTTTKTENGHGLQNSSQLKFFNVHHLKNFYKLTNKND